MRPVFLLTLIVALSLLAASSQAAGRRMRGAPAPQQGYVQPHGYPSYYDQKMYMWSMYPKYQAGFHSRALQNIGIPPGDIGPRGNPYHYGYGSPW